MIKEYYIKLFFLAVLILHPIFINGQDFSEEKKTLSKLLEENYNPNLPGGSLTILHQGKVIFDEKYGVENLENKKPISSKSQFYIASLGKTFTSTAILYLWERNLIDLDNPVSDIIGGIEILDKVTIRQLLTHSSGMPDYYDAFGENSSNLTNTDVLKFIKSSKLEFEPGSKYSYSNSGYILLSLIIEEVTGSTYSDFLNSIIFNKLDLSNTLIANSNSVKFQDKVTGYNSNNTINDYNNFTYGSGGIYSSSSDILKWYDAIRESKILTKSTWELAFKPPEIPDVRTYLAMGWNYEDCGIKYPNLYSVASFGVLNGFRAYLFMIPELDFTVIMLSNNGQSLIDPYTVMDIFLSKFYKS